MIKAKVELATLAVGVALLAVGVSSVPASEIFLIIGSGVSSLAVALLLLTWTQQRAATKIAQYDTSSPPAALPSDPEVPVGSSIPSSVSSSLGPEESISEGEASLKTKLLPTTTPKPTLPKYITDHQVPIAFVVAGTALSIAALATISPQAGLFGGLLIPGGLLLGLGVAMLILDLYQRPLISRRFCMHCGFQMSTLAASCGRCGKPPFPGGVDTKSCPNCEAIIPALAKFCRDCGAGQADRA